MKYHGVSKPSGRPCFAFILLVPPNCEVRYRTTASAFYSTVLCRLSYSMAPKDDVSGGEVASTVNNKLRGHEGYITG